jgi:RNA polymerase sigma-70 factor (ECF subfamily)
LIRNRPEAEELAQDCLERAITYWHQRRQNGNVRAWLFAILRNLAFNRLRQLRRRGPHIALGDADESELPLAHPDDGLRQRDLTSALDSLTTEQRETMLLVCVDGMSYAETASTLNLPIGTVMSRIARARAKFRQVAE